MPFGRWTLLKALLDELHIGATSWIQFHHPSAAAMQPYVKLLWTIFTTIIRPHHSITYVDADVTNRVAWSVCWCVGLSICHSSEPWKTAEPIDMPFGLRTWVGSNEPCIRWVPDPPLGRGNFEGKWQSIIKYKDALQWSMQKWLNRSRCRFGTWTWLACISWGCTLGPPGEYHWTVHVQRPRGLLSGYCTSMFSII